MKNVHVNIKSLVDVNRILQWEFEDKRLVGVDAQYEYYADEEGHVELKRIPGSAFSYDDVLPSNIMEVIYNDGYCGYMLKDKALPHAGFGIANYKVQTKYFYDFSTVTVFKHQVYVNLKLGGRGGGVNEWYPVLFKSETSYFHETSKSMSCDDGLEVKGYIDVPENMYITCVEAPNWMDDFPHLSVKYSDGVYEYEYRLKVVEFKVSYAHTGAAQSEWAANEATNHFEIFEGLRTVGKV